MSLTTFTHHHHQKKKTPQGQLPTVVFKSQSKCLEPKRTPKHLHVWNLKWWQLHLFKTNSTPSFLWFAKLKAYLMGKRDTRLKTNLAMALRRAHPVASKSPSFFPLIKVCFDLSISPQTTIKKAIYQINTEYCKSHLQAACRFPRRGCHANSCSMFTVQKYQFQQSPAS